MKFSLGHSVSIWSKDNPFGTKGCDLWKLLIEFSQSVAWVWLIYDFEFSLFVWCLHRYSVVRTNRTDEYTTKHVLAYSKFFLTEVTNFLISFKVHMTRKFLLMKNIKLNVLISNLKVKVSKTKPFLRYSDLKINFLLKKVSGDLGRVFDLWRKVFGWEEWT